MWNPFRRRQSFTAGNPWLLRFFDQVRFHEVGQRELLEFRAAFPRGRARLEIEETTFRFADYRGFLDANRDSIEAFRARQRRAFVEERERWAALPPAARTSRAGPRRRRAALPPGAIRFAPASPAASGPSPWPPVHRVAAGDRLIVLETMKMEAPVVAPEAGTVVAIAARPVPWCAPGRRWWPSNPTASGGANRSVGAAPRGHFCETPPPCRPPESSPIAASS